MDVLLHAYLLDYPMADDGFFPFTLTWRVCKALDFNVASIDDLTVKIGEQAETINYEGFD